MLKIEKFLFYLFVFLLPFQIGKFLFAVSPLSAQAGLPESFYHQVFIYLSDILIFAILTFWGHRIIDSSQERKDFYRALKKDFALILFFFFAGISIVFANNKGISFFHSLKLLEFIAFYFYVRQNFKYVNTDKFSHIIIASAILQAFIVGLQFYFQEDIGLKYFGESPLSPIIDGVAKINENGFKLMRAYGTFPHPNVLAVFWSFVLFVAHYLYLHNKTGIRHELDIIRHNKTGTDNVIDGQIKQQLYLWFRTRFFYAAVFFAIIFGLFLSFSRSAIFSTIIVSFLFLTSLVFYKKYNIERKSIYKLAFLLLIIFSALMIVFGGEIVLRFSESESISQRIFYADIAKSAIAQFPLLGVGIGNFIDYFYLKLPNLQEWQYQPAHNLFLLIFAEIGIFGILLFLIFIIQSFYKAFRNSENLFQYIILFAFLNFLILANIDHYFWTLQQGQILFWLVLGILNSQIKDNK